MDFTLIGLITVFLIFYFIIFKLSKNDKSFSFKVFFALIGGLLFGGTVQMLFGNASSTVQNFTEFISVFGSGYIKLLKMMVIPLVLVAMIASIGTSKSTPSITA